MSTPILPFAVWAPGTNQNSVPANDNSLRNEILNGLVISDSTTAQPGSPADGAIYIIPASATGAIWSTLTVGDLVIYRSGTWYAFAPVNGIVVNVAGTLKRWNGTAYVDAASGGGGGSDRSTVTSVSSSSGVVTLDYDLGDYFTLALAENVTSWVIDNPPGSGKGFTLMVQITQDSTPRTVAKPGTTAGGAALDVSTGSGDIDVLAITSFNNGTTLRSSIGKDFS